MPIRDILWSNPEWFRTNIGDVQPLVQSIKEHGLQVPILLTEDLLVLDGARRLTAYMSMGRKEIPVVITNNWDRVIGHLERTRAVEASGFPFEYMSWEDLDALWRLGIIPLHKSEKIAKMIKTTAERKKRGIPRPAVNSTSFAVNESLSQAFAMEVSTVKGVRDTFAALRGIEEKLRPTDDQKKALRGLVLQAEAKSPDGQFVGLYGLRNLLREFSKGAIPIKDAASILNAKEQSGRRVRDQVTAWEQNRRRVPATESEIIANFCRVVSQFGDEAQQFRSFDSKLNTGPLIEQIRVAVNRFNALRRRLESGATTEGEQDS